MPTIERRVTDLENARAADVGPLVLYVDEPPTEDQGRMIEDAERIGRAVVPVRGHDINL